jgi:protein phosphatase
VVADVVDVDAVPDGAAPGTAVQVVGAAATDRNRPTRGGGGAAGRAASLAASAKANDAASQPAPVEADKAGQPAKPRRRERRRSGANASDEADSPGPDGDLEESRRPSRLRRRLVTALIGVLALAAIAVGAAAFYSWSQSQYYVGEAGGEVAIYQGINQVIGPIEFSHVDSLTGVTVASLPQVSQDRLRETLPAASLGEVQEKLRVFLADAGPTSMDPPGSGG